MLCFLHKTLSNDMFGARVSFRNPLLSVFLRRITTVSTEKRSSFTVNYLVNTCGFSPESALAASKYINLKTPEKPDSVLAFLKRHDFTENQILKLIQTNPFVISSNPEKTLLPKFKFFNSLGLSAIDLAKILTRNPILLLRSLENRIIPSFNFLKSFIQEKEKVVVAFKRFPKGIVLDLEGIVVPNFEILREAGVPDSCIPKLFCQSPRTFVAKPDYFRKIVEEVKEMGFNPKTSNFFTAFYALKGMSKLTWKRKVEVYKMWNLSEEEIQAAFKRFPWCMTLSENKIMATMDYYINTMGWETSVVINKPIILSYSLEKRTVPRCAVLQVLLSKGLLKKDYSLYSLLDTSEELFLKRFVSCYKEDAPQLLKIYKEKQDLGTKDL